MGMSMRDSYREQLDDILADLVQMAQVVRRRCVPRTTALLEADIHLAEQVITEDERLDAKQSEIEAGLLPAGTAVAGRR